MLTGKQFDQQEPWWWSHFMFRTTQQLSKWSFLLLQDIYHVHIGVGRWSRAVGGVPLDRKVHLTLASLDVMYCNFIGACKRKNSYLRWKLSYWYGPIVGLSVGMILSYEEMTLMLPPVSILMLLCDWVGMIIHANLRICIARIKGTSKNIVFFQIGVHLVNICATKIKQCLTIYNLIVWTKPIQQRRGCLPVIWSLEVPTLHI